MARLKMQPDIRKDPMTFTLRSLGNWYRNSHRLVDQTIGLCVVDEQLFVGIESQAAPQTHGDLGQIH